MKDHEPVTSATQGFPGGLAGGCFDRLANPGGSAAVIVGAVAGAAAPPATPAGVAATHVPPNAVAAPLPDEDAAFEPFEFSGYGDANSDFGHFSAATYPLELPTSFLFDPRELPYAEVSLQAAGAVPPHGGTLREQLLCQGGGGSIPEGGGGGGAYVVALNGGGQFAFAAGHSFPPTAATLNPRFITLETPATGQPPPTPTPAPPSAPESRPVDARLVPSSTQEKRSARATPSEDNAAELVWPDQHSGKKWRPFSASQREKLEAVYAKDQHPSKQVKERLSAESGLTVKQVDGWFGRRRAKEDSSKNDSSKSQSNTAPAAKASDQPAKTAEQTGERTSESPAVASENERISPTSANDMALLMAELPKLVDESGGLKDEQAVDAMKNLLVKDMKDISLGAKSVWLNAVKRTSRQAALKKVAGLKITTVIRNWLHVAVKENSDLQLLLLEVIKHLPITVDVLQKTQLGKLVRKANSSESEDVKQKAEEVLAHLRKVVDEEKRRRDEAERRAAEQERLQAEAEDRERREKARLKEELERKKQEELRCQAEKREEIAAKMAKEAEERAAREQAEREQRLQELEMKRMKESEERLAREAEILQREIKMEEERRAAREADARKRSDLVRRNVADDSFSRKKPKPNESGGFMDLSDLEVTEPIASPAVGEFESGVSAAPTSSAVADSRAFMNVRRATEAEVAAAATPSLSSSPETAGGRSILKRIGESDPAAPRARRLSSGVKFAPPTELVTVHEIESINPMDVEDVSADPEERSERRYAFLKAMQVDAPWVLPKAVRLSEKSKNAVRVVETEESMLQKQREANTLMAVYLDRNSVPPSPSEAKVEVCEDANPVAVPLIDVSKGVPVSTDVTPSTTDATLPRTTPLSILPGSFPILSKSQTDKLADILKNLTNMGAAPPPSVPFSASDPAKPAAATSLHQPASAPAPAAAQLTPPSGSAAADVNSILSMLSGGPGPKASGSQPAALFGSAPSTAPPQQHPPAFPPIQPTTPAAASAQPQAPLRVPGSPPSQPPGIDSSMLNDILATINGLGKPAPPPQPAVPPTVPAHASAPYRPDMPAPVAPYRPVPPGPSAPYRPEMPLVPASADVAHTGFSSYITQSGGRPRQQQEQQPIGAAAQVSQTVGNGQAYALASMTAGLVPPPPDPSSVGHHPSSYSRLPLAGPQAPYNSGEYHSQLLNLQGSYRQQPPMHKGGSPNQQSFSSGQQRAAAAPYGPQADLPRPLELSLQQQQQQQQQGPYGQNAGNVAQNSVQLLAHNHGQSGVYKHQPEAYGHSAPSQAPSGYGGHAVHGYGAGQAPHRQPPPGGVQQVGYRRPSPQAPQQPQAAATDTGSQKIFGQQQQQQQQQYVPQSAPYGAAQQNALNDSQAAARAFGGQAAQASPNVDGPYGRYGQGPQGNPPYGQSPYPQQPRGVPGPGPGARGPGRGEGGGGVGGGGGGGWTRGGSGGAQAAKSAGQHHQHHPHHGHGHGHAHLSRRGTTLHGTAGGRN